MVCATCQKWPFSGAGPTERCCSGAGGGARQGEGKTPHPMASSVRCMRIVPKGRRGLAINSRVKCNPRPGKSVTYSRNKRVEGRHAPRH